MAGDVSAVGAETSWESKGMMMLQVKQVLAEMNFVVEAGNCFVKVMMIWEVETVPGHVASMQLMQQTVAVAAGAVDIAADAAVAFPLPVGQQWLAAVN